MPAPTMVTAPLDKDEKKAVTLREVFTPKTLNSFGIFWTIAGDVFLLNLGFFLAFIFDVDLTQAATSFFTPSKVDCSMWGRNSNSASRLPMPAVRPK